MKVIDRLLGFVFSANSKSPEKFAREKARAEFEAMEPTGAGAYFVFKKTGKDHGQATGGPVVPQNVPRASKPLVFPDKPCMPTKSAFFK